MIATPPSIGASKKEQGVILTRALTCSKGFAFGSFALLISHATPAVDYSGRASASFLYLQDNFSSTSLVEVYEGATCDNPGQLDFLVVGSDPAAVTLCAERCCQVRSIGSDGDTVERQIENPDGSNTSIIERSNGSDSSLYSTLGIHADAKKGAYSGEIDGKFRRRWLDPRTTYGSDRNRFRFTKLYGAYEDLEAKYPYKISLGRRPVIGGVLVDGVVGHYYFGPSSNKTSKRVGAFAGLAPDPITRHPSLDYTTFGFDFSYIPDFSSASETKLRLDAGLVSELFKGDWNRLYLFSRAHYTPLRKLSFFYDSTVELPAPSGDDKKIDSSRFSLNAIYRPSNRWFLSGGFTQYRIDRFLKEESVRYLTDGDSAQSLRVGETLDRSHRFRFDARASYKVRRFLQPYIKARYERRNFDSNKTFLNVNPNDPTNTVSDLALLGDKDSYRASFGFRVFPDIPIETDTQITYRQGYRSKHIDFYQDASYQLHRKWSFDAYFQLFLSERNLRNSVTGNTTETLETTDFYLGLGAHYKFLSDFAAQIRYDLACEEDPQIENDILIHSALLRLDYKF